MPNTQTVQVHAGKTYDIAGSAKDADGNAIALTNLDFTPDSWAWGSQEADSDAADNNCAMVIAADAPVGATQVCEFDAEGPNEADYDAHGVTVEVVAADVEPQPFEVVFTARV